MSFLIAFFIDGSFADRLSLAY